MKVITFDNEEDWLNSRVGKITGTKVPDVLTFRGTAKKKGFWALIAERVEVKEEGYENAMERGKRLEEEAVIKFCAETGKKVDTTLQLWISDEDSSIALSPDGAIGKTEALEVKCLNSASHIEALITKEVPADYHYQVLQYFIVNSDLKKLYFAFFDPRIPAKEFFYLTINRKDIAEEIEKIKAEEIAQLKEIERITLELTGY